MSRCTFLAVGATLLMNYCSPVQKMGRSKVTYAVLAEWVPHQRIVVSRNPDLPLPAASLVKLLIAVAAIQQDAASAIGVDDKSAVVTPASLSAKSDFLTGLHPGERLPIRMLLSRMIQQSDNFAANVLIEHLSMARINATANRVGLQTMRVHGLFIDTDVRLISRSYTTARDCNKLLHHIAREMHNSIGTLEHEAYLALVKMMINQDDRRFIPSVVPRGIVVADKTGEVYGEINDSAIISPFAATPMLFTVLAHGHIDAYSANGSYEKVVSQIQHAIQMYYHEAARQEP